MVENADLKKPFKSRGKIGIPGNTIDRRFSVAPMMDWTDRHCRYFHRLLSPSTLLYTEMVTTGALIHADAERFLRFNNEEHPVALQLGGSSAKDLAYCALLAEQHGYDEVNLNCGCPSDRVQNGAFGACLMHSPDLVAEAVSAMMASCDIAVTVKCRIGVDDQDEYSDLQRFTEALVLSGCRSLTVHARKAWLKGLSPKENRDIPPLNYERVYQLKQDFPQLEIIINGGISDLNSVVSHLNRVDGVMMGRAAYHNPWLLTEVETQIFGSKPRFSSRLEALQAFYPYIEKQLEQGERLNAMTKAALGLFQGQPGTKQFKRYISENAHKENAGIEVLEKATEHLHSSANSNRVLDEVG